MIVPRPWLNRAKWFWGSFLDVVNLLLPDDCPLDNIVTVNSLIKAFSVVSKLDRK